MAKRGRNNPPGFRLNSSQNTSIPSSLLSWEDVKRESNAKNKRRGAHGAGGYGFAELVDPFLSAGSAIAGSELGRLARAGVSGLEAIEGARGTSPSGAGATVEGLIADNLTRAPQTERGGQNLLGAMESMDSLMTPLTAMTDFTGGAAEGMLPGGTPDWLKKDVRALGELAPEVAALGLGPLTRGAGAMRKALANMPEANRMPQGPGSRQGGMLGGSGAAKLKPGVPHMAHQMKQAGNTPEEIWEATGDAYGQPAFFDSDGNFKWEFDDSKAEYKNDDGWGRMEDVFDHPEYYANYPELGGLSYSENKNLAAYGEFAPGSRGKGSIALRGGMTPDDTRSTMLHEMNHGIQYQDKLPVGGNPGIFRKEANEAKMNHEKWGKQVDELHEQYMKASQRKLGDGWIMDAEDEARNVRHVARLQSKIDTLQDKQGVAEQTMRRDPNKAYYAIQGEQDARAVQARRNLTMDERLARPFWKDFDERGRPNSPIYRYR